MNWVNTYVDEYYRWLRQKTVIQEGDYSEWVLIDTPFLGAFNDTIEIYAKKNGAYITLSDNGETLNNLELQGLHFQGSKKRRSILDSILVNHGVKLVEDELLLETHFDNFSQSKHNFLNAIIEINDLYVLSQHNVAGIFKEDVRAFLDKNGLIYTPDFISKGTTGLEFTFDFQIAQRNKEVVIKSFNTINKSNLPNFLFSWDDIKPVREKVTKKEVKAIAFINDVAKEVKKEFLDALTSRDAEYILWTERNTEENLRLLSAA
ncbi:DUF1828 domain-containing protein [Salinimicrobium sp. GXAS 041]|uniref:DUF1828 domain-containing protein n=1 Tax=Salinimicrobium sp. GXAS 041 TaxID=3400806 RepID=UPI003C736C95